MTIHDLPAINAVLNTCSTVLLTGGWIFISRGRRKQHAACMIVALITSAAFLACYLTWHGYLQKTTGRGHVTFTHTGGIAVLYRTILYTHLVGAIAIVPLVPMTVLRALREKFDRHRRLGRWTLPLWLYVSVTGVAVYFMLYQWFPPEQVLQWRK